ncbi:MAG TPA: hypothetical protein VGL60_01195 [Acidimicrobiales bacterium]
MTTLKTGVRLGCPECTTQVIVIAAPTTDVTLTCSGAPLGDVASGATGSGHQGAGVQLGKRYADDELGLELLCTKAGPGTLEVDGGPLPQKGTKQLPSSD